MPFNPKDFMKGVNANISKINTTTAKSTPFRVPTKLSEKEVILRSKEKYEKEVGKPFDLEKARMEQNVGKLWSDTMKYQKIKRNMLKIKE